MPLPGLKGRDAVRLTADIAAEAAGCRPEEVFLASTGVIGEPLDATKFQGVLDDCAERARRTAGSTRPGPS
jgi:glutamate N-acetyltransferase/amino-acid N-acetyltransferase